MTEESETVRDRTPGWVDGGPGKCGVLSMKGEGVSKVGNGQNSLTEERMSEKCQEALGLAIRKQLVT